MHPIDAATGLCAVIGHPVGHSLSPAIHNAAFTALGLNYVYLAFDITDLGGFVQGMRAMPSFRGASVTIPHKRAIQDYLDALDPLAERIGSVNTVVRSGNRLTGYSTDGPGTLRAFSDAGVDLAGKRVLFLGGGGAVRAVAFAFALHTKTAGITLLGRTRARIEALVADLASATDVPVIAGDLAGDIRGAIAQHDVIIQGTPIGMHPETVGQSAVPADALQTRHVVFDMVYNPHDTRLLQDAAVAGCTRVYGIEMLLQQAALQFELWTDEPAPIDAMREAVARAT